MDINTFTTVLGVQKLQLGDDQARYDELVKKREEGTLGFPNERDEIVEIRKRALRRSS